MAENNVGDEKLETRIEKIPPKRLEPLNYSVPGTKETEEVLHALDVLSVAVVKAVKDGLHIGDPLQVVASREVRQAIVKAVEDIDSVPNEIKDLTTDERLRLSRMGIDMVSNVLKALEG